MENNTIKGAPFVTRDLYLASALLSLKFELTDINFQIEGYKQSPVGYFSFDRTPEIEEAESQYLKGNLALEPREYVSNMRMLKSRVSNDTKNPFSKLRD